MLVFMERLPDFRSRGPELAEFLRHYRKDDIILHSTARYGCWERRPGPLSLKFAWGGEVRHAEGRRRFVVHDGQYLVLNDGTWYSTRIACATRPVEALTVYFGRETVGRVLAALTGADAVLLDDPCRCPPPGAGLFHERTHAMRDRIGARARRLRRRIAAKEATPLWMEEQVHGFAADLLALHQRVRAEVARVPAARASTREEVYRRLHVARDYLEASLAEEVTLPELARSACMAPHHFLRSFRAVFHETPVRYLGRRRLERARDLLRTSRLPVGEVSLAVGFQNASAFSRAFRREFGTAPQAARSRLPGVRPLVKLIEDDEGGEPGAAAAA